MVGGCGSEWTGWEEERRGSVAVVGREWSVGGYGQPIGMAPMSPSQGSFSHLLLSTHPRARRVDGEERRVLCIGLVGMI